MFENHLSFIVQCRVNLLNKYILILSNIDNMGFHRNSRKFQTRLTER